LARGEEATVTELEGWDVRSLDTAEVLVFLVKDEGRFVGKLSTGLTASDANLEK
jgi:hypothetical protein